MSGHVHPSILDDSAVLGTTRLLIMVQEERGFTVMHEQGKRTDREPGANKSREGKYLSFFLGCEEYGISILKVKEIIGMIQVTPIPQTPDYVKGVLNLRGKVIPVIDLRLRFGMNRAEYTDRTCIVVVEVGSSSGSLHIGTVVDSVSEVINIKSSDIEDTPGFGMTLSTEYILGMAKMAGGVRILLDIDKVLNTDELMMLDQVA